MKSNSLKIKLNSNSLKIKLNPMTGYPIKQEYYTIVTSITASLIALGFCGSIWLFAKMTKNSKNSTFVNLTKN